MSRLIKGSEARRGKSIPHTMSAKRWCVTINNYSDDDIDRIRAYCTEENCQYAVFGKEIGKNGTLHLQGFLHLHKKVRLTTVKKNISINGHYEMAKGSDEQNQEYCKKDGDLLLEVGTPAPKPGTNNSFVQATELTDKVVAGQSLGKLVYENPNYKTAYFKHGRSINDTVQTIKRHLHTEYRFEEMSNLNLIFYPWQVELSNILQQPPHPRKILWYVDYAGCAGKSTFTDYYRARHPAKKITGGKINDLCYSYDYERVVFFDFARGKETNYLNVFIEDIKNGFIFSAKYQSFDKSFKPPHVVIFSNYPPPYGSFSKDRLEVRDITHPLQYVPVPSSHLPKEENAQAIPKDFSQKKSVRATSPVPSTSALSPQETIGPLQQGKKPVEPSSSR